MSCFNRIEEYLDKTPMLTQASPASPRDSGSGMGVTELRELPALTPQPPAIATFDHADISWNAHSEEATLQDLNLTILNGFTAVTGPVASGKSTLLESLIGETCLQRGSITSAALRRAYCSQTPWIMNDTIRENIIGALGYDQKWYDFSLSCCALDGDIAKMPLGDTSMAGSKGTSLSGGQRQRIVSVLMQLHYRKL